MNTPTRPAGIEASDPPVWSPAFANESAAGAEDAGNGPEAAGMAPAIELVKAPLSRAAVRVPQRRTNSVTGLLIVAALVAAGGVSFAVGHATAGGQTSTTSQNGDANGLPAGFPNASGAPGFGGGPGGFGGAAAVTGTVVSVAADSITVKLASGQTVTVATGSSTTYHNQTSGSSTDLAAGQTVQVQTSGGVPTGASASASPGSQTTRTATDVTITAP